MSLKILEWSERLEILEMALYEEAGGQRTEFAINQLRLMQEFAQAPGLTPLSSELEDGMADILTFAQALFGGMSDARDDFAADIEHEKKLKSSSISIRNSSKPNPVQRILWQIHFWLLTILKTTLKKF